MKSGHESLLMNTPRTFSYYIQSVVKNPYFGFIILSFLLILIQMLNQIGLVDVSFTRAFGKFIFYFIVALGFSILLGYAGLASLGTAGLVGFGAYACGYFMQTLGLPFGLTLLISILIAVVLGIIVGFISLRIAGLYLAIITLGLSEILVELYKTMDTVTNGVAGFLLKRYPTVLGLQLTRETTYYMLVVFMFVLIVLTMNIINSPIGRAMLAMKNSESAAQALGVSLMKYRLIAFVIATCYAVLGGFLYMSYIRFSIPTEWNLGLSLNILAAVIVGGAKSIMGVMVGTLMIFSLNETVLQNIRFFNQNPNVILMFNGLLIIIIILFYPGGLTQFYKEFKLKFLKLKKRIREHKYGK